MDKFKEVKSWIGDDGYIHLGIKFSAVDANGQEWEMDIPDAMLPLSHTDSTVSYTYEYGLDNSVWEERHRYLKLRSDKLILNSRQDEAAYTMRMIPKKMTKKEIEKELGYTVEIVPDEKLFRWCSSCVHRAKGLHEHPCALCYRDPKGPCFEPLWSE